MAWAQEVIVGVAGTRLMARNEREMCNYFAQLYLRNEQGTSIGTGPLCVI